MVHALKSLSAGRYRDEDARARKLPKRSSLERIPEQATVKEAPGAAALYKKTASPMVALFLVWKISKGSPRDTGWDSTRPITESVGMGISAPA